MSEIDWSKAPEGATHWFSPFFYRVDAHDVVAMHETKWLRSSYTKSELLGRDGCIARQVTWTGAGLPPVLVEVEWLQGCGHDWECVTVLAYYADMAWILTKDGWPKTVANPANFRPIRTQEQIEAEERDKAVRELSAIISSKIIDRSAAVAIYEAGYRKQGEGK